MHCNKFHHQLLKKIENKIEDENQIATP